MVIVSAFVGRRRELALLDGLLGEVREQTGMAPGGEVRDRQGRRRIGKSALVEEFIERRETGDRYRAPRGEFARPAWHDS